MCYRILSSGDCFPHPNCTCNQWCCPSRHVLLLQGWACPEHSIPVGTVIWGGYLSRTNRCPVSKFDTDWEGCRELGKEGREHVKQKQSKTETDENSHLVKSSWKPMNGTNEAGMMDVCVEGRR